MTTERSQPFYVCPSDRAPLAVYAGSARCPVCGSSYPFQEGIALLDSVRRRDRQYFDESASGIRALTPEQRTAGERKATTLLGHAEIGQLHKATVLDLGCGFGDLTYGLASIGVLKDSDFYAVDHSVESLRVLSASVFPSNGNRVHLSTQDASALCFPENNFDLIVGSAILHHVLDYRSLLDTILRFLKPGGKAVFAEPFVYGYLLPSLMLAIAVDHLKLSPKDLERPEFGMCRFILEDVSLRIQHENDLSALDDLADKHLFRETGLMETASSVGFSRISFADYEPPEFYRGFMRHLMSISNITHSGLVSTAARSYDICQNMLGNKFPGLFSHFKYIVLLK
jgi:2-polyprenyl-3-methyl-5-hydroxy-6-metoxy-1,4-benzoquinol methylase